MIKQMAETEKNAWLKEYVNDFSRRFVTLLSYGFSAFSTRLALDLLQCNASSADEADESVLLAEFSLSASIPQQPARPLCHECQVANILGDFATVSNPPPFSIEVVIGSDGVYKVLNREELSVHFSNYDLKRLEMYSLNLVDHHLITDLLPLVARLVFLKKIPVHLSGIQSSILLGMGLQRKSVDDVAKELNYPATQVLGLFNRIIKKIVQAFCEVAIESEMPKPTQQQVSKPPQQSLEQELEEYGRVGDVKVNKRIESLLSDIDLSQYAVHDDDNNWNKALKGHQPSGMLSVKRIVHPTTTEVNKFAQKKRKNKVSR
ncbi:unnamed protein product [Soboliphyme baturini]|uniref:tRNA_bind_2 domain-containing protein n=1 Tax=Soboliphyme baturini TaxID=241478 RepID=A0A183IKJ7_9BILA|nr:unnamed protein product [Soboliphyme baturini]